MVGAFLRKRTARNFRCPTAAKELQRFFGRGTYFQGHRRDSATELGPTFTEHFTEYLKASLESGTVTIQPKKSMINDIM
jgi:hypothetical protein